MHADPDRIERNTSRRFRKAIAKSFIIDQARGRVFAECALACTGHRDRVCGDSLLALQWRRSVLAGVAPGLVPVLARGIDDATVGLEELVGDLEDRQHQPALGTPGDVAAALLAPDEFAGLAFDALRRAFLVDK